MFAKQHSLSNNEVERYSRQIIVEEIGVEGQERIRSKSVLVVGVGGLGCPVAMYCAGAGFGRIGIIDEDSIAVHNLHRQTAYNERQIGLSKVLTLQMEISFLNTGLVVDAYEERLTKFNAIDIVKKYDIIADCSDNIATRYLINDACVLQNKPLVSGSALRWEGQFTVYNYGKECPCYRCIFPQPPPAEAVQNCSQNGIVGAVVGVIGSTQALEIIKIAALQASSFAGRLFLFDGLNGNSKTIKLRNRDVRCAICGTKPLITRLEHCFDMYDRCDQCDNPKVNVLHKENRLTPVQFSKINVDKKPLLIDVRPLHEFRIAHLINARNIPIRDILKMSVEGILAKLDCDVFTLRRRGVCVICRRGNDSQLVVIDLYKKFRGTAIPIKDIEGGYECWAETVDISFPRY